MLKKVILKIPGAKKIAKAKQFSEEFRYDKMFFKRHYSHSKETQNKIGYNMLLLSHSLEKGMSTKNTHRFGTDKIEALIGKNGLIDRFKSFGNYKDNWTFICVINVLRSYCKLYEAKGWKDADEYKITAAFIKNYEDIEILDTEKCIVKKKDIEKSFKVDYKGFIASRHSVREFLPKKLSESDFKKAVDIARLSPSACNRQMCKAYYVSNKTKAKRILSLAQGFGCFELDTINLILVTFDVNANYMVGERNQGWFNAGLFSMNLINAMHSLGIGSCFCQFGNSVKDEEIVKKQLNISPSERIAVLIAAGYYCDECFAPRSPRKPLSDLFKIV